RMPVRGVNDARVGGCRPFAEQESSSLGMYLTTIFSSLKRTYLLSHNALPRQPAGIVDDRTGRQFLHLRSPHHGTLRCSTVGRAEHCSGTGCARISCLLVYHRQLLLSILFWILNSLPGCPARRTLPLRFL